jgi:predicted acetyltransferase
MPSSLSLRWVGEPDLDRVAETRWLCYAHASRDLQRFKDGIRADPRAVVGDFLLAERDGMGVGTATGLSMDMWVRGSKIPCQGVAYVGAIKTERRRSTGNQDQGVATAVMREILARARERQQIISALMPFRVSFYEHFGYGVMERRTDWTIPLSILPPGPSDGWRMHKPTDQPAMAQCHQRMVESGQCEVERTLAGWATFAAKPETGFLFVQRPDPTGPVRAWILAVHQVVKDRDLLRIEDWAADSAHSFSRILCLLGSLRDQYASAIISVPSDWQLNRLLKEAQIPHRPVNHHVAETRIYTRMQCRILDHKRFLEVLHLPTFLSGSIAVAVHETEGHTSKFQIDLSAGRISVKPANSPQFECSDRTWAAIACGDLPASHALRMALAQENHPGSAALLDVLSLGPLPFCHEYF